MTAVISCDGQHAEPRGVLGGLPGTAGATWQMEEGAQSTRHPTVIQVTVEPGRAPGIVSLKRKSVRKRPPKGAPEKTQQTKKKPEPNDDLPVSELPP